MSTDVENPVRHPLIRLLDNGFDAFAEELARRVTHTEYNDIRITHGCVFGNIEPDGSRLTELAERAKMTKQSVGEVATELEQRGYLERVPDPRDGRAMGREIIDEIEREWAERYGAARIAALRDALEAINAERLGAMPVA
jgi:DNA-binding MarR family transcriptional regulator